MKIAFAYFSHLKIKTKMKKGQHLETTVNVQWSQERQLQRQETQTGAIYISVKILQLCFIFIGNNRQTLMRCSGGTQRRKTYGKKQQQWKAKMKKVYPREMLCKYSYVNINLKQN